MSALDKFTSLDETVTAIKREHETELRAMKDQLLAAQIEAEMARSRLAEALADRDKYMRVATKLIAQFGTVEKVFADAKAMALEHEESEARARAEVKPVARVEHPREADDPAPLFLTKRPALAAIPYG